MESPHHFHGVDNSQVALDADAGEEADTGVHVNVKEDAGQPAEVIAKHPDTLIEIVGHKKWQSDHIEEIGNTQVKDKNIQGCPFLPVHT